MTSAPRGPMDVSEHEMTLGSSRPTNGCCRGLPWTVDAGNLDSQRQSRDVCLRFPRRTEVPGTIPISMSQAFGPASVLAWKPFRHATNCFAISCAWQLTLAHEMVFLLIH